MKRIYLAIIALVLSCNMAWSQAIATYDFNHTINKDYIGNGPQWDPYQLDYGKGKLEISEEDWQKLYHRLDFMRPQFMRIVINTHEYIKDGKLLLGKELGQLTHILGYCQQKQVTVVFGDWGWGLMDAKTATIDRKKIELTADFVTYLVQKKGYSCIKYYNFINEPNGYWSSTEGNYDMWREATLCLYQRLKKNKMLKSIQLVGADLAIWTPQEVEWQERASKDFDFGLYDIHTYPSKITVNSGEYSKIIKAYKDASPKGKKIVMGEIGLKFVEPQDSIYKQENLRRAATKPYASLDDSQMFVYDYMYGIDVADAIIQTANMGYSGSIAWMLDDAMHSAEAPNKLKIWGFWNILGEECFGDKEEEIRPWFYAWSLLTRYMPKGCDMFESYVANNPFIKTLAVKKDGMSMIAIVNVSKLPQKVLLKGSEDLVGCKKYVYAEGKLNISDENILNPNEKNVDLKLTNGIHAEMPGESMLIYTNFNY